MGVAASLVRARVGSETYFDSVERTLKRLDDDVHRLESVTTARLARADAAAVLIKAYGGAAFVLAAAVAAAAVRRPPGELTPRQHASRVAPLFLVPLAVAAALTLVRMLVRLLNARDAAALTRARARLVRAVAELKDATRHDTTARLVERYDPQVKARRRQQQQQKVASPGVKQPPPPSTTTRGPAALATAALATAGNALLPALDKLAAGVVGDNPVLTAALTDARRETDALRSALAAAHARAAALAAENEGLKRRLGGGVPSPTRDGVDGRSKAS